MYFEIWTGCSEKASKDDDATRTIYEVEKPIIKKAETIFWASKCSHCWFKILPTGVVLKKNEV